MDRRIPVTLVALIEVLAPERMLAGVVRLLAKDAGAARPRRTLVALLRLKGLVLLGWVAWQSRDAIGYAATEFDTEIDLEEVEPPTRPEDRPTLTPGTRRHDIAAVLYHADAPLAASDVVDLSEDTDWEMGRSTASATLYRMFNDDLVAREERTDDGSFEYWLTETAQELLERADEPIRPDPFAA